MPILLFHHPRFMDVLIEIVRIRYRGDKYLKVRIKWWNRGQCGEPWYTGIEERNRKIPIKFWSELKPWRVIK